MSKGFTLVELMITVAIIGVLASISYPSYVDSVLKSQRAEGKADIMMLSGFLERKMSLNNTYVLPVGQLPVASDYYNYAVASGVSTYTITAAPVGNQANDTCGTMTLNETGLGLPAACW